MEENKEEEKQNRNSSNFNEPLFVDEAVIELVSRGVLAVGETLTNGEVLSFLKDKFNIVGEGAVELATKLPKAVVEKIESFDGSGLSSIAQSVSDTITSIELPDIDFPDIDIDF